MENQEVPGVDSADAGHSQTAQQRQRQLRRRRRKRLMNGSLICIGIVLIVGCFAMASYSYIFIEDCKECSSSKRGTDMAKVFRFLSAGLFLIGVFLVAFSLCTYRGEHAADTFGNADLRRISLQTVACFVSEAALEKSPSVFCASYSNPGLNCSISNLTEPIPEITRGAHVISVSCYSNRIDSPPIRYPSLLELRAPDEDVINPPPSYREALTMQIQEQFRKNS